jgi:transcriptional regulator with XRE-family HTH domain
MSITNIHASKSDKGLDYEVSRRVNMLMWDRKRTQGSVAQELGITQSTYSRKVRGVLGWSVADLVAVSAALGTTISYLVGESDNPDDPKSPRQESNLRPRDYLAVVSELKRSAS